MKPKEAARTELIGKNIEVTDAANKKLVGIKGKIVDETRATLHLDTGKHLIKEQVKITMNIGNETVTLDGKQLVGRPEDRLKKVKHLEN